MNRPFRLVEHRPADPEADPRAVLYTVHFDGEAESETDAFFNEPAVQKHPVFDSVRVRYAQLYQQIGLYAPEANSPKLDEKWLRDEGEGCVALCGKKIGRARLRLLSGNPHVLRLYGFCIDRLLLQDQPHLLDGLYPGEPGYPIAVFGGGGVKTSENSPRDCPNVAQHFVAIHHVRRRLLARLDEGTVEIGVDGFTLDGDLTFPAEP